MPSVSPPLDPSITTLFLGNVTQTITELDLQEAFNPYGELESIKILKDKNCAFITYHIRTAAETAASCIGRKLNIKGNSLVLRWGKPRSLSTTEFETSAKLIHCENVGLNSSRKAGFIVSMKDKRPYPSMDPNQFGSLPKLEEIN